MNLADPIQMHDAAGAAAIDASRHNSNSRRTADVLFRFNRPAVDSLYRAYDHLIAARRGMTLMLPVGATAGRLIPMVDRCPIPWLEASAILAADYAAAAPLSLVALVQQSRRIHRSASPLGQFARSVMAAFLGSETELPVALADKDWRHAQITLSQGGEPCRVFIGAAGVRLAFTPDFLEGIL